MVGGRRRKARATSARADERGAAMFVVLMILMILGGVGTFAVRNAQFELQTSGYGKQRSVAQQVMSLGAEAASSEFGVNAMVYLNFMRNAAVTKESCAANGIPTLLNPNPDCYHLYVQDIERRTNLTAERLMALPVGTTPGTFGVQPMTGMFWVELTDIRDSDRTPPGYSMGDPRGSPTFFQVTLTSTGVVFQDPDLNGIMEATGGERNGATYVTGRGHVTVGPIFVTPAKAPPAG